MFDLTDKIAVITGAGRGIGQAIALNFASAGAKVAVVSRTEVNASQAAAVINAQFTNAARAYAVDVADGEAVAAMGKQVLADFGKVDILVNNAGFNQNQIKITWIIL